MMATQTNFVVAIVAYDNRCPLNDDVANQIALALTNGGYDAVAVNVTSLVTATMIAPLSGTNQINIELVSPSGTSDEAIEAWVTDAILGLNLPTVPTIVVNSVTVFDPAPVTSGTQTNWAQATVSWNNGDIQASAVSQALMNYLTGTKWRVAPLITPAPSCTACTVETLTQGSPGTNSVAIEIITPTGTTTAQVIAFLTAAITDLNNGQVGVNQKWPEMGTVTILSIAAQ